jgi:AraC-like DNA-binding protein
MRSSSLLPTVTSELLPGSRRSGVLGMHAFSHIPSSTLEILRGAPPSGPGPIRISLEDVPERDRLGVYREFFGRSVFRMDMEPLADYPFEVDALLQTLPGLQLLTGKRQGWRNRRTREMLADGADGYTFVLNLRGPYAVSTSQREIVLDDGDATFMSVAEPMSLTHYPPGLLLALRFPRAPFASLVTGAEDCYLRRIPAGTEALRLLRDYVDITWREQTMTSPDLQHLVVSHIYDLMALAIGATRDAAHIAEGRGLRAARLAAIKQEIARNLEQGDLSVAALAARHRCTERFVQRLFEMEGTTFTEYVLAQRLARAHRMLSDPRRDGEKISTVAYDCGFGDVSYFNRVFRRRYGIAPSDVRAQARQATHGQLAAPAVRDAVPTA